MSENDKVGRWLNNLKLFAINAEIHCSREEKVINQECVGTRHVNLAFNEMIKHMHKDLNFQNENDLSQQVIIEGGNQVLLFSIGDNNYYTDISLIHELIAYPTTNYNEIRISDNLPMVSILNWYEGLIPLIDTDLLIDKESTDKNYLIIYDIGKEIFAFTISNFYPKHEIESSSYGESIEINGHYFELLDLSSYENELIKLRMKMVL